MNPSENFVGTIYDSRRSLQLKMSSTSHQLGYKLVTTGTPNFTASSPSRKLLILSCRYNLKDGKGRCPVQLKAASVLIEEPEGKWKIISFVSEHSHPATKLGAWKPPAIRTKRKAAVVEVPASDRIRRRVDPSKVDDSNGKSARDMQGAKERSGQENFGFELAHLSNEQEEHTPHQKKPDIQPDSSSYSDRQLFPLKVDWPLDSGTRIESGYPSPPSDHYYSGAVPL